MSIGTDAFVRSFVAKTCRDIIDDVEKLDSIQDDFIHFILSSTQMVGIRIGKHRTQIGMFHPIRMDHTNCLQVAIKTLQFNSGLTLSFTCHILRVVFKWCDF